MLGNVFKAYDIRGVYPDPLNEKLAWQIGYGASSFLRDQATRSGDRTPMLNNIVVGRDMRLSSPALAQALIDGITDAGGDVVDVGRVDTPFVTFAVNHLDCAGGIMVTASHNPPQYNGFKISARKGKPVGEATGLGEIRMRAAMANPDKMKAPPDKKGRVERRDLWEAYAAHVRRHLKPGPRQLRVVVDASNGMAGTMLPKVFGEQGAGVEGLEIVELYFDNSKGQFVHEPNPLVLENLRDLQDLTQREGADLGVCFDGDADRCALVDETGAAVGCDHVTAWLSREFLKDSPGAAVVYDLRSSKAVEEEIVAAGGKPVRSRVGHVFMKQAMAEHDAVFGGELSGHFYFRTNFYADSGAIAFAAAVSALRSANKPLSEIIKPIARYAQSGEINFEVEDKDAALALVEKAFANRGRIDQLDGVTVDCFETEGWWCNLRKSNTEPLLRPNLEARSNAQMAQMVDEIARLVSEAAGQ